MGNTPLRHPNTKKTHKDESNGFITYGLCEMQGWRSTMVTFFLSIPNQEDANISVLDHNQLFHIFGVFDGHGGQLIAKFVANNYIEILTNLESFKNNNIEQAMIEVNLKIDQILKYKKVNEILIKKFPNHESKSIPLIDMTNANSYNKNNNQNQTGSNSEMFFLSSDDKKDKDKIVISGIFSKDKENKDHKNSMYNLESNSISPQLRKEKLNFDDDFQEIDLNSEMIDMDMSKIAFNTGTTANVVLIMNNIMYFSNIGDSIAVIFKNGKAERINNEHKTILPSESMRIISAGKKIIGDRIEGRINLSRAIGNYYFDD